MSTRELADYELSCPRSLKEATALLKGGAFPIAGCTDWMVERHTSPIADERIRATAIDVTRVAELRGVTEKAGVICIGAAEPFLRLRRDPMIAKACPLLAEMAAEVGALQIQARGTLGGNLVSGSPAADGVVALFALDAGVVLANAQGERTVPITRFYTGYRASVRNPDELVVRFELKAPGVGAVQKWRKIGTRTAQSISKAAFAAVVEIDGAGVITRAGLGAGSVAPTVRGLDKARALMVGRKAGELDLDALEAAVEADIAPIDDLRSTARYRRHVVRILVRRLAEELAAKK
jgi:xanthine dehydrogenase small subunit